MLGEQFFKYRVYGLVISSEFEIKELKPAECDAVADVTIKFADLGLLHPEAGVKFAFSENRQEVILPMVGAFIIEGLDTVLVEPNPDVTHDFLAVPLLGPVLAILLHMRRKFILHGSAVIIDGKAFGFVGDKGAGKSTLAAMLLKNPDVDFLTDDLLVISNELEVLRGYPQMKLSDEALSHSNRQLGQVRPPPIEEFPKHQFLLDQQLPDEPVPIGGIFDLRRGAVAEVEDLILQDAIRVLLRFSYIARFFDREMAQSEKRDLFNVTTKIAALQHVKRLHVPDRIDNLDQVLQTLRSETVQT